MSIASIKKPWFQDPSLWTLIGVNIVVMLFALIQKWDFATALWVYWGQSVAIGVVGIVRILVGETKTEYGYGVLDSVTRFLGNILSVGVFLVHYGGFHLAHFLFLREFFGIPPSTEYLSMGVGAVMFFLHHLHEFLYHRERKTNKLTNPYMRILPMHGTLVLFPVVRNAMFLFLMVRMLVDIALHVFEHQPNKE